MNPKIFGVFTVLLLSVCLVLILCNISPWGAGLPRAGDVWAFHTSDPYSGLNGQEDIVLSCSNGYVLAVPTAYPDIPRDKLQLWSCRRIAFTANRTFVRRTWDSRCDPPYNKPPVEAK